MDIQVTEEGFVAKSVQEIKPEIVEKNGFLVVRLNAKKSELPKIDFDKLLKKAREERIEKFLKTF